jgi:outer membrane protein OmpA-like peptidoglycan-associated protein
MSRRFIVVSVLAAVSVTSTGCLATRNFVRENVQQSETKTGAELARVDGQLTETRGVADEATKRAVAANDLAGQAGAKADEANQAAGRAANRAEEGIGLATQAQAKADQTDTRLTRLWTNRHKYAIVDTLVISFAFDKWRLDDRAETSLLDVVRQLNDNPGLSVNVEGYTDNVGSADYNLELSRRRAESVRRFIVEKGIELHRIQTIGLGEARPTAANTTKQGRDQNRRVAIRLLTPSE